MNKAKQLSSTDGYKFLREAFAAEQNALKSRLELANSSITHNGELGAVNEQSFIDFLRQNLPQRYAVNSAIILDSEGKSSDQIDVVIHDRYYSPTLLSQNRRAFVPIEAVYAIFEVKPTINKTYLEYASEKARSVRALAPRTGTFMTINGPKEVLPLKLLAGLIAIDVEWTEGLRAKAFEKCMKKLSGDARLDCGVAVSGEYFHLFGNSGKPSIEQGSNSLALFTFGLLHQLQLMGNAPGVDWKSYVHALQPAHGRSK